MLFVSRKRMRVPVAMTYSGGGARSRCRENSSGEFVTGRAPAVKALAAPGSRTLRTGSAGWGEAEVIGACGDLYTRVDSVSPLARTRVRVTVSRAPSRDRLHRSMSE